ncbi:MAG: molybdopterin-guanine dinucleotide biosynthesis protein A [Firmicutes bacterium]|nr:molybdopterin-guanine dinucleotide biosynthesis protein A [Bacillota bacterium]
MKPVYAVILAGDNLDHKVREGEAVANKAFLAINGRPMLEYVIDCYLQTDLAGVAVVGPEDKLSTLVGDDVKVIPQQGSMIANILAAARELEGTLILSSCDIPLITSQAVEDFLSRCRDAELFYPLVSREDNERVFPGMKRTYAKLRDGVFTGGNIIVIDSGAVPVAAKAAEQFFEARKSPLRMARLVGLGTLCKLVSRRLSLTEIEAKMSSILGVRCRAILSAYPELGTDVDKESDYKLISARLPSWQPQAK